MKSRTAIGFRRRLQELPDEIRSAAEHTYEVWRANPWHPSLHFKRVGNSRPIWSVRIGRDWRALAVRDIDGTFVWFWIGLHDEYDRLIGGSDD
ncbi:MAG: hypothetical protein HY059_08130 [Proteobacteria bacterium]|nr:hypothetical protein [Pseudomonadota bacterium]